MNAPASSDAPAATTACAAIVTPSRITVGSGARSAADEVRDNTTGFPTIAASWIRTPAPISTPGWITTFAPISTSCGSTTSGSIWRPGARSEDRSTRTRFQRLLQSLEHAHDAQPAATVGDGWPALADRLGEVPALDPQRLLVRDA